jgi:hypothetical protein
MDLVRQEFVAGMREFVSFFLGGGYVVAHHPELIDLLPNRRSCDSQLVTDTLSGNRRYRPFKNLEDFESRIRHRFTAWSQFVLMGGDRDLFRRPVSILPTGVP